jgi:hypothetical protein
VGEAAAVSYEAFGRELFRQVLHRERIEDAVATVLGDRIEVGPFGAGPGRRFATIRAVGTIARPRAEPLPGELVAYRVTLPVNVDFDLDLGVDLHQFRADVLVPLRLTARAETPLTIVLDIAPPAEEELVVEVSVDKRRTAVLRRLAGIDDELRGFLCRYVKRELAKDHVVRASRIHLGEVIDAAWPMISRMYLEGVSRTAHPARVEVTNDVEERSG